MMNGGDNSSAFTKIKPLCVNFIRSCTIDNISKLENAVQELDSDSAELLQEFIMVPFILHLNRKQSEKITIKCIDFLTLLFNKTKLRTWKMFADIFNVLMFKISNIQEAHKLSKTSEELKSSICKNMLCLVQCSSEEILNEMYSLSFRPQLAHALYMFNVMLRDEKSKNLLKDVLCTVAGLTYHEEYIKSKYKTTELIASESLASCLPGLSIALQKVIIGDDKQAHAVISLALNIFTQLITLVISNESYERQVAKDTSSKIYTFAYKSGILSATEELNSVEPVPVVLKDDNWFKSVAEKLEIIIKNISTVAAHNHWKVRLQFLKCSEELLMKCSKTLENCISILLPVIFGLSVDKNSDVSSNAKDIIISLSKKLENMNCKVLNATVEDNIEKLVGQLIKYKLSANDSRKLSILKSLLGYIDISRSSVNKLVFSVTSLERLILTLINLLEFNVTELNLVEEIPDTENFDVTNSLWPKKRFKYFENEETLSVICRICYSLRHMGNSRVLIDYLLEKLSSSNLHTLQCIFVIGSVIKGLSAEQDASQKYSELVADVLEMFLSPSLFDVLLYNVDEDNTEGNSESLELALTGNVLNRNKLQVCLLLESIAHCSECLGTDFRLHLTRVLCPVMEKAGSTNYVISHCGRLCLNYIAQFCKYKCIPELIKDNADYITNIIMINFHQYLHKPEIAVVLRVAMEQSDAEAVVLFRDLIFQILEILDYNQGRAYSLMHVLFSIVVCIKKWFPCKKSPASAFSAKSIMHNNLRVAVKDYIALKKTVLDSENENNTEDSKDVTHHPEMEELKGKKAGGDDDDYDTGEKKSQVPLHINIVCEIFKRCIHLQSSENRFVRMLTLETVEQCILVLRDSDRQLHPLVHEFWSPFLRRFAEDAFAAKAFEVLLVIANECGDFIRSRTFKEVMPKLILFLQRESPKSLMKCHFKQYQWTQDHALQILLLSEVGNLCSKLDIDDRDVNKIVTVCLQYLNKGQPQVLQEAAIKSLKALATIDPDAVWFYWNVSYGKENTLKPPHDDLLEIYFPFSDNTSQSALFDL